MSSGSLRRIILIPLLLMAVAESNAEVVSIGQFCLQGVSDNPGHLEGQDEESGKWTPKHYRYPSDGNFKGWIYVFEKPIVPATWPEDCSAMAKRSIATGNSVVIAGKLTSLDIEALRFTPSAGTPESNTASKRWIIPEGKLTATIIEVTSGNRPVLGGTVDFAKSKAWLNNRTSSLKIEPDSISGELEIESWNRTVKGASIRLPGGLSFIGDLTQVPQKYDSEKSCNNTCFRLDVATGKVRVWDGQLRGSITQTADGESVIIGPIVAEKAKLKATSAEVIVSHGIMSISLRGLQGRMGSADLNGSSFTQRMTDTSFQAKLVSGTGNVNAVSGAIDAADLGLEAVTLSSASAILGRRNQTEILKGQLSGNIASASAETVKQAVFAWTKPSLPAFQFLVPDGKALSLNLTFDGPLLQPKIEGKLRSSGIAIGPGLLDQQFIVKIGPLSGDLTVSIPIDINTPATSGLFLLQGENQVGLLKATLKSVKLIGKLILDFAEIKNSRLEVAKENFAAGLKAAAATQELLAGAKPTFGEAEISLTNTTDIVAAEKSSGVFQLITTAMIIGRPKIQVGKQATAGRLQVDLHSEGAVILDYDLYKSAFTFASGELSAEEFKFQLTDVPSPTIDLGGTIVVNPTGQVKQLKVSAARVLEGDKYITNQSGEITSLSVTADRVTKTRVSDQNYFDGAPSEPIHFDKLTASSEMRAEVLEFENTDLEGFAFGLKDAQYEEVGGIRISNAALAISMASLRKKKEKIPPPAIIKPEASESSPQNPPDLQFDISEPKPNLEEKKPSQIEVTVRNSGTITVPKPVTVGFTLLSGFTVSSPFIDSNWTCSAVVSKLSCTSPEPLDPTSSKVFRVSVTPDAAGVSSQEVKYTETTTVDTLAVSAKGKINELGDVDFTLAPQAVLNISASGLIDKLNGKGGLSIDPTAAHKKFQIIFDPRIACTSGDIDDSGRLKIPMRADIVFAALNASVDLVEGQFSAIALAPGLTLTTQSTAAASCRSENEEFEVAAATSGWTNGLCTACCAPPKVYGCEWHWSTPRIWFGYYNKALVASVTAAATMPAGFIRYKNNKADICQPGYGPTPSGVIAPFVITPQILTGALWPIYPGAQELVNTALLTTLGAWETMVTTAIANGALWSSLTANNLAASCLR